MPRPFPKIFYVERLVSDESSPYEGWVTCEVIIAPDSGAAYRRMMQMDMGLPVGHTPTYFRLVEGRSV